MKSVPQFGQPLKTKDYVEEIIVPTEQKKLAASFKGIFFS